MYLVLLFYEVYTGTQAVCARHRVSCGSSCRAKTLVLSSCGAAGPPSPQSGRAEHPGKCLCDQFTQSNTIRIVFRVLAVLASTEINICKTFRGCCLECLSQPAAAKIGLPCSVLLLHLVVRAISCMCRPTINMMQRFSKATVNRQTSSIWHIRWAVSHSV